MKPASIANCVSSYEKQFLPFEALVYVTEFFEFCRTIPIMSGAKFNYPAQTSPNRAFRAKIRRSWWMTSVASDILTVTAQ
jgi:hypothetical protein